MRLPFAQVSPFVLFLTHVARYAQAFSSSGAGMRSRGIGAFARAGDGAGADAGVFDDRHQLFAQHMNLFGGGLRTADK